MAIYKCQECGHVMENRCKPGKCKSCGAPRDKLDRQDKKK